MQITGTSPQILQAPCWQFSCFPHPVEKCWEGRKWSIREASDVSDLLKALTANFILSYERVDNQWWSQEFAEAHNVEKTEENRRRTKCIPWKTFLQMTHPLVSRRKVWAMTKVSDISLEQKTKSTEPCRETKKKVEIGSSKLSSLPCSLNYVQEALLLAWLLQRQPDMSQSYSARERKKNLKTTPAYFEKAQCINSWWQSDPVLHFMKRKRPRKKKK